MDESGQLASARYLSRSIAPHIRRLSDLFNRKETDQESGISEKYWKSSSNTQNLRLAYFLYFRPTNLYRMASVWTELARLGFKWPFSGPLSAIDFGCGFGSAASGLAAAESHCGVGLPTAGSWAFIEKDRKVLDWGVKWAQEYFAAKNLPEWSVRPFHRRLDPNKTGFLPPRAPQFQLWLMSYFLNEFDLPASKLAEILLKTWDQHLAENGMVLIIEPALKLQSRKLLEFRQALLELMPQVRGQGLQVLLPCLGHQSCGALSRPEDWCHEEVTWWRPPYYRKLDEIVKLDHKSLPFSYLVLIRNNRPIEELLPALKGYPEGSRERLVSPSYATGRDQRFYLCGKAGKRRVQYRGDLSPQRGDILEGTEVEENPQLSRLKTVKKIG